MAHIRVIDESGRDWIVLKGDPGWEAANKAKTKLLLDSPVLPLSVILTGQPDVTICQVHQEMRDYLTVKQLVGAGVQEMVWPKIKLRFRAWRTQQGVFGNTDGGVKPTA